MKVNDIVKYSKPANEEEASFRFVLADDRGDRVAIRLICDETIQPVEVVAKDEVCAA